MSLRFGETHCKVQCCDASQKIINNEYMKSDNLGFVEGVHSSLCLCRSATLKED